MTDDSKEVQMVECSLTGNHFDVETMISFTPEGSKEPRYAHGATVLELVQKTSLINVVIENLALNDKAFNEMVSIRKQYLANNEGMQKGAVQALTAIKKASEDLGVDIDAVLKKAFPTAPATTEPTVTEQKTSEG